MSSITPSLPFKVVGYWLFKRLSRPRIMPINVTVSVTNMCNSRCRTCYIWKLYLEKPHLRDQELKIWEFERIFQSLGKSPLIVTISGGEPYLRPDLAQICIAIYEYCRPKALIIPTNALLTDAVKTTTEKILQKVDEVEVIVNISLDGVNELHDEIRGVKGNFQRLLQTHRALQNLKLRYPNLTLGVHTVISRWNVGYLQEIYEYVRDFLKPDTYITEIAEHREELLNLNNDIAPTLEQYSKAIDYLISNIAFDYAKNAKLLQKIQHAFRIEYYRLVVEMLRYGRSIPCYAGYASAHINPYGDVWPCCILAYKMPLGNLRDVNYDFKKVWSSKRADFIRKHLNLNKCYCPMANANYTNMLENPLITLRTFLRVLKWSL
uniref:Radical SAM protein n=1 Tax=Ignisphaera aggregans TaxID=334771 RepID=A0A7C4FGU8_9CREN